MNPAMPLPRNITSNPFYQPSQQWQLRITLQREHIHAIEEAFEDIALSISSFEISEATGQWYSEILMETPPQEADIPSRLTLASGLLGIPTPACEIKLLEKRDWVSEVERGFPPITIGRFHVRGSHINTPMPSGRIGLLVNAGAAFGSGEHATTSGCLLALSLLSKSRAFRNPLDMGCGSGILAMAMAKLWHRPVLGTDIDPVSVITSRENAQQNQLSILTRYETADGYHSPVIRKRAPFDIITANILAKPLCRMAPALAGSLAPGGIAILSGLLATQEAMVLAAHRAQGLTLRMRICRQGWNTLVVSNARH